MPDISINGKTADITLESERTVGELISGIDRWLHDSDFRLNGLEIDGEPVDSQSVALVFGRDLDGVRALDIKVCSGSELALDALGDAAAMLAAFGEALTAGDREKARSVAETWESGAAASFLQAEFPELFQDLDAVLHGPGTNTAALGNIVEERIRELARPLEETERTVDMAALVASRLEELPLDIQCGRDGRAAETAALFSAAAEKLFRLYRILRIQGADFSGTEINSLSMDAFLEEFSGAVREMLAAWQGRDLVLVGDLAEYELAPRLKDFPAALLSVKERS